MPSLLDHQQANIINKLITFLLALVGEEYCVCCLPPSLSLHLFLSLSLFCPPVVIVSDSQVKFMFTLACPPWLSQWSAEADSEKLLSQLMCLEVCATFNGLLQHCNFKCCMLTCALMVALACLLGVFVGQILARWKRLVV